MLQIEKQHAVQDLPKAIVNCLGKLDVFGLQQLLPAGIAYHQDISDQAFVAALFELIDHFTQLGDTALEVKVGSCHGCLMREKPRLFVLIGNHSKAGVAIYFRSAEGKLSNIGFCRYAHYHMNSEICDPVLYLKSAKESKPYWYLTPYHERAMPPQPRPIPKTPITPPGFGKNPKS
jgi:hypothetical protein